MPPFVGELGRSWPPPTPQDLDRVQSHISLQNFGEGLQQAANACFPNQVGNRYSKVYVLLLYWEDEDFELPVSLEVNQLSHVFRESYNFSTRIWKIPSNGSHNKLNQEVLDFINEGNDSKYDLKLVYYGGHGALASNRQPIWMSRNDSKDPKYRVVRWGGIQNALEEARSDVLIFLDCCASGTANNDDGRGVTELVAACGFNDSTPPVGSTSFTRALITELERASRNPTTVAILHNRILSRIIRSAPEERQLQMCPIHVFLTQDKKLARCIQLCPMFVSPGRLDRRMVANNLPKDFCSRGGPAVNPGSNYEYEDFPSRPPSIDFESESSTPGLTRSSSYSSSISSQIDSFPRIALTIYLAETLPLSEESTDQFIEWLRMMPILASNVKTEIPPNLVRPEAMFASFSTLLIISLPVALWCCMPSHPAIINMGLIKSSNFLLRDVKPTDTPLFGIAHKVSPPAGNVPTVGSSKGDPVTKPSPGDDKASESRPHGKRLWTDVATSGPSWKSPLFIAPIQSGTKVSQPSCPRSHRPSSSRTALTLEDSGYGSLGRPPTDKVTKPNGNTNKPRRYNKSFHQRPTSRNDSAKFADRRGAAPSQDIGQSPTLPKAWGKNQKKPGNR